MNERMNENTGSTAINSLLSPRTNPPTLSRQKKHYEDTKVALERRFDFPNCQIISTEFSRFQVARFLLPRPPAATTTATPSGLSSPAVHNAPSRSMINSNYYNKKPVRYLTLLREPFARLLSQYRHDKHYTSRRFADCKGLGALLAKGSRCIIGFGGGGGAAAVAGEPAYRYQNFQSMMLGGCVWSHKAMECVPLSADDPRVRPSNRGRVVGAASAAASATAAATAATTTAAPRRGPLSSSSNPPSSSSAGASLSYASYSESLSYASPSSSSKHPPLGSCSLSASPGPSSRPSACWR